MPSLHHTHPEPEERTPVTVPSLSIHKPKHEAKFALMPEAWQQQIQEARRIQLDLGLADGAFAGSVLSGPAWNQLINGAYPMPSSPRGQEQLSAKISDLLKRCEILLRNREEEQLQAENRTIAERFIDRPELQDVLDAIADARKRQKRGMEERVIIITGPTRAGKSWMIEKLKASQEIQWHMRATGGMKGRYRAFLEGMATAMKLRDLEAKTVDALEKSILDKLSTFDGVLAIEELQRFSSRALEFFKDLLNHSKVSLLISMLPGQYRRMCRCSNEDMQQFLGRCVLTVPLQVSEDLVKHYAPDLWKRCPEASRIAHMIAEEAQRGGGMALVREVCENTKILTPRQGSVSRENVERALLAYRQAFPVDSTRSTQAFGRSRKEAA